MVDMSLEFPSLYLSAEDFEGGKEATLTIKRVVKETVKSERGEEQKWIIYFEELHAKAVAAGTPDKQKRMILGKSFNTDLVSFFGKESEGWPGKRVVLYKGKAIKGGKQCIRGRFVQPTTTTPSTPTNTPQ